MAEEQKMKKCSKCGKEYPATTEYFVKCSTQKDGLYYTCKVCKCVMGNASYEKHKEYRKQYARDKRKGILPTHKKPPKKPPIMIDGIVYSKRQYNKIISDMFIQKNLTQDILHKEVEYFPDTGKITHIGIYKFGIHYSTGYEFVRLNGTSYPSHRLIWFYVYGWWPECIDHINGDRLDNRLQNLRDATHRENLLNKYIHREGKLPGANKYSVYKWSATVIDDDHRIIHLGSYNTEREASLVYCRYLLSRGMVRRHFLPSMFTDEELGIK